MSNSETTTSSGGAQPTDEVVETIDAALAPGEKPSGLEGPLDEAYNPDKMRDLARANITYCGFLGFSRC